jgi:hypothetical protein
MWSSSENFEFPLPESKGFYCCFSFEDAEIIFRYLFSPRKDTNFMDWVEVFRAIQLTSLLPAYDKQPCENNNYVLCENPFLRGFFYCDTKNETMVYYYYYLLLISTQYQYMCRVIKALVSDPASRRWWRRWNNTPVPLYSSSVPIELRPVETKKLEIKDLDNCDINLAGDSEGLNPNNNLLFSLLSSKLLHTRPPYSSLLFSSPINTDELYYHIPVLYLFIYLLFLFLFLFFFFSCV